MDVRQLELRANTLFAVLWQFKEERILTDLVLVVSNQRIDCHRAILAPFSRLVRRMDPGEVRLENVDFENLRRFIDDMYTLQRLRIQAHNAKAYLEIVDALEIDVPSFLRDNIAMRDCVGVLHLAQEISHNALEEAALDRLLVSFVYPRHLISGSNLLRVLLKLTEADLIRVISNDDLLVPSESAVFSALKRWTRIVPGREAAFLRIVKHVRLNEISNLSFKARDRLLNNREGREMLEKALSCRQTSTRTLKFLPLAVQLSNKMSILTKLLGMAEENKASDLVLEVAGNKIHCHKVIMAAASPFFKVMLTSGLKESIEGHVKLPGARYDVIRKIVDAVYGQDFVLDSDNVQDALMACHQYGFTLIQERCVQQMLPLVNNENCLGVYILGKKYDIAELKAKAAPHFCDICAERSSNLSHLSAHDWDFIIKRTKFSPSLFQLLIYWVHFDRYDRLVALDSIIQQVAITKCDLLRDSLFREICEREKCLLLEANVL